MNRVAVILNYFKLFLHYPQFDDSATYYYLTAKRRYCNDAISNLLYVDWKEYRAERFHARGDVSSYFKFSNTIGSIPPFVNIDELAGYYEIMIERFFEKERINCLLSGGITGFERIGLAVAHRLGIKTFCIWEGYFRPNTISVDPVGMNAESSIMKIPYRDLVRHNSSREYEEFYKQYCEGLNTHGSVNKTLREIHGDKFKMFRQLRNRWGDRYDIERIRLPLKQHLHARGSYYNPAHSYKMLEDISKPFLFFSLQTHTDSNVVLNAGLFPYSRYVSLVQKAFQLTERKNNIQLVIKEHPFDVLRIAYSKQNNKNILWIHPEIPSSEVLRHKQCLGSIVVNSTAGLESLILGKPVLCLGKAIYGHPELVEKSSNESKEEIAEAMLRLFSRNVDSTEVHKFCGALYDYMQIPLNIESVPGKGDVQVFWEKLRKQ